MTIEEFAERLSELANVKVDIESAKETYEYLTKGKDIISVEDQPSELSMRNAFRAKRALNLRGDFELLQAKLAYKSDNLSFVPQDMPYDDILVFYESGKVVTLYMMLNEIRYGKK